MRSIIGTVSFHDSYFPYGKPGHVFLPYSLDICPQHSFLNHDLRRPKPAMFKMNQLPVFINALIINNVTWNALILEI